jgi:hypothetical protein
VVMSGRGDYFVHGRTAWFTLASTVLFCSLRVPSLSLCLMKQNTVHTGHKFYALLLLLWGWAVELHDLYLSPNITGLRLKGNVADCDACEMHREF